MDTNILEEHTSSIFRATVNWVKNMVKLYSQATKGRRSISSTEQGIGNTTQPKPIQKVNRKCEEPRNKMVLFMVKLSKQNDMEEDGDSTFL
jgi:hypothetical protein